MLDIILLKLICTWNIWELEGLGRVLGSEFHIKDWA